MIQELDHKNMFFSGMFRKNKTEQTLETYKIKSSDNRVFIQSNNSVSCETNMEL